MRRLNASAPSLALCTAALVLLLAPALSACSVRSSVPDAAHGGALATAVDNRAEALAPVLAELAALPTPPGADAAQFAMLKDAFRQLLLSDDLHSKCKGVSAGL